MKLFAIAYAGGSAVNTYSRWGTQLPKDVEVIPLEYAGHGVRMAEPLCQSVGEVVDDLIGSILEHISLGEQYCFYGHSMGCVVVYELIRKLNSVGQHAAQCVFLSGRVTPGVLPTKTIHQRSDADFIAEIVKIGGTPEGFFDIDELSDAFLPIIKSDYKIIERYRMEKPRFKTTADIVYFLSDEDPMVSEGSARLWANYGQGSFLLKKYAGDHFFIQNRYTDICKDIASSLSGEVKQVSA